jgi:hypothetical protein
MRNEPGRLERGLHAFLYIYPCQLVGLRNCPTAQSLRSSLRCFVTLFLAAVLLFKFRPKYKLWTTATGFAAKTSVSTSQHRSTIAPYSHSLLYNLHYVRLAIDGVRS